MILTREGIQRMIDGVGNGAAGGGGGDISALLAGYATESWVDENYLSIEFFSKLFKAYNSANPAVEIKPNDTQSTITNIKAMFGFWTEQYLSALGQNSGGGGGGVGDVTWDALESPSDYRQIALSHLTTALSGYATQSWVNTQGFLTSADINDMATKTWVTSQGYLTAITSSQIITALGYTPANNADFANYLPLTAGSSKPLTGELCVALDSVGQVRLGHDNNNDGKFAYFFWSKTGQLIGLKDDGGINGLFFRSENSNNSQYIHTIYHSGNLSPVTTSNVGSYAVTSVNGSGVGSVNLYLGTTLLQTSSAAQSVTGIIDVTASGSYQITNTTNADRAFKIHNSIDDVYFGLNSTLAYVWVLGNHTLRFGTGSTSRIEILGNGNVGIGTTTPTQKLQVDGNIVAAASDATFIQIGAIKLVYDATNTALKVVHSDGTTAANFYASGGVSALGYGVSGGGGAGDVTWDALESSTDERPIALSHLTDALAGYATTSQLAGYLPLSGGTMTGRIKGSGVDFQGIGSTDWKQGIRVFPDSTDHYALVTVCTETLSSLISLVLNESQTRYGFDVKKNSSTIYAIDFPSKNGTIALTSDLNGYLPLTGGTINGTDDLSVVRSAAGGVRLLVRNTGNGTSAHSILSLGNDTAANGGVLFLNSSTRTSDGGANTLTIRNDIGKMRLGVDTEITYFDALKVGVGTDDPSYKLDVNGTFNATTIYQNGVALGARAFDNTAYLPLTAGPSKPVTGELCVALDDQGQVRLGHDNSTTGKFAYFCWSKRGQLIGLKDDGGINGLFFRSAGSNDSQYIHTVYHTGNLSPVTTSNVSSYAVTSVNGSGVGSVGLYLGTTYLQTSSAAQSVTGIVDVTASGNYQITNTTNADRAFKIHNSIDDVYFGLNASQAYVWVVGNHELRFGTNATARIVILGGGNVGIGTTSPNYKLDVNGVIHTNDHVYLDSRLYMDNANILYCSNSAKLSILACGEQASTIQIRPKAMSNDTNCTTFLSNGNVGISTTSPSYKLHVIGDIYSSDAAHSQSIELNESGGLVDYGGFIDFHYNGTSNYSDYSLRLVESTANVLSIQAKNTSDSSVRAGLEVGKGYDYSYIDIGGARIVYRADQNALRITDPNGGTMNLYATGGVSALGMNTIATDGTVSANLVPSATETYNIGSTSYLWKYVYANRFYSYYNSSKYGYFYQGTGGVSIGTSYGFLFLSSDTDLILETGAGIVIGNDVREYTSYTVEIHGNTYFTGSISAYSVTQRSDMRWKNVVSDLTLNTESIANAPLFKYTFKDGDKRMMVGTSAQYWNVVMPQTVFTDAEGMMSLDYGVTALASVISVAREVSEHERRIAKLEAENAKLRAEIEDLKAA